MSFWNGARRGEEYEKDTCRCGVAFVGLRVYVRGAECILCVDDMGDGRLLYCGRSVMYDSE